MKPKRTTQESDAQLIGYACASGNGTAQRDALAAAGCVTIHVDQVDDKSRPERARAIEALRAGDTLIVPRLGHVARGLAELFELAEGLAARQIHLRSIEEQIDTRDREGAAFYTWAAVLAAFDRGQKRGRANAGLASARASGRKGGRRKALTPSQVKAIRLQLQRDPTLTVTEICEQHGIARATFYKHVGSVLPDPTPAT